MMMGHGPVQPGWDNPNCGWHTARPDDPLDGHRGSRAPTAGSPVGQGKGTGASPTLCGVVRPKAVVVVEMQEQPPCGGGADHHGDCDGGGGVGQRFRTKAQR
jgi:hypothetical protein